PPIAATRTLKSNGNVDTAVGVPLAQAGMGVVRVLFDGVPAPILSAQASQIVAIAPYSLAGKTATQMRIEYNGLTSSPVTVQVTVNGGLVNTPYAGAAPGYAGIMQVNAQLDPDTPSGSASLIVQTGSKGAQTALIYVR